LIFFLETKEDKKYCAKYGSNSVDIKRNHSVKERLQTWGEKKVVEENVVIRPLGAKSLFKGIAGRSTREIYHCLRSS
jgi:hypothetical protein